MLPYEIVKIFPGTFLTVSVVGTFFQCGGAVDWILGQETKVPVQCG